MLSDAQNCRSNWSHVRRLSRVLHQKRDVVQVVVGSSFEGSDIQYGKATVCKLNDHIDLLYMYTTKIPSDACVASLSTSYLRTQTKLCCSPGSRGHSNSCGAVPLRIRIQLPDGRFSPDRYRICGDETPIHRYKYRPVKRVHLTVWTSICHQLLIYGMTIPTMICHALYEASHPV